MVILQFNRFIRNKWAWGAVAVLFCVMFVGTDIVSNLGRSGGKKVEGAGQLAGETVDLSEFNAFVSDARGYGRGRDESSSNVELNRKAWEAYAAAEVAKKAGVRITDSQLAQTIEGMFAAQGGLDFNRYQMMVQSELGLTPEAFEAYLRRQMSVREGVERTLLGTAAWVSPMEADQLVADMTDKFTVKVASFTQDKAAADAIKLDEAGLKKWYDANTDKVALPERTKIRYVKFDALKPEMLAKMTVTQDDMSDFFDANSEKYPAAATNETGTVLSFDKQTDEIKAAIEKELRQIELVTYYETNLNRRAYATEVAEADKGKSRVDVIAAEEGLKVETSNWFATEGGYVEGFMSYASSILPGAQDFLEKVAELDSSVEDLRYGIVTSDKAVWLVEKAETSAAHTPTFEECKGRIDAQALRSAKADAFKAEVEAVAAKGIEAVLASKDVSTNITFTVTDFPRGAIADQASVIRAATKLKKGEISEFTLTGTGRAILVVCEDRVAGDPAAAVMMRRQAEEQAAFGQLRDLAAKWPAWNLERMGLKTTDATSVTAAEEAADEDEAPAAEETEKTEPAQA